MHCIKPHQLYSCESKTHLSCQFWPKVLWHATLHYLLFSQTKATRSKFKIWLYTRAQCATLKSSLTMTKACFLYKHFSDCVSIPSYSFPEHNCWELLTFTDIAVWSHRLAVSMMRGWGRALRHGLLGAVVRVMKVKHVADVAEQAGRRSWSKSGPGRHGSQIMR